MILWMIATGQDPTVVTTLAGHNGSVTGIAFNSDSALLASSSGDDTVRVWDIKAGKSLVNLTGHAGSVSSVAFSEDGKLLVSGGGNGTNRLWAVVN